MYSPNFRSRKYRIYYLHIEKIGKTHNIQKWGRPKISNALMVISLLVKTQLTIIHEETCPAYQLDCEAMWRVSILFGGKPFLRDGTQRRTKGISVANERGKGAIYQMLLVCALPQPLYNVINDNQQQNHTSQPNHCTMFTMHLYYCTYDQLAQTRKLPILQEFPRLPFQ